MEGIKVTILFDLFVCIIPCCYFQCIIIQCLFFSIRFQIDFFAFAFVFAIMLLCILHLSFIHAKLSSYNALLHSAIIPFFYFRFQTEGSFQWLLYGAERNRSTTCWHNYSWYCRSNNVKRKKEWQNKECNNALFDDNLTWTTTNVKYTEA